VKGRTGPAILPAMATRQLRRWYPMRIGALAVGLAWLGLVAALGYAATAQQPSTAALAAAAASLLIAASGILYAWREPDR